jgi:hypothetical protein
MLTRNLDVTYSMVWVIVLSNIIAVAVSFLFLNQLVKLTYVKASLLVPFLLVLTALGAYTAHNSLADIVLMLVATIVGIGAIKWNWPRAPMLLALVLGDIAERYLFLSYSLYEWSWLSRPLVIAFAAITIAGLVWPLIRGRDSGVRSAPRLADGLITIGFLAGGAYVLYQASAWPFRTAVFPLMTGFVLVALSLVKLGGQVGRLIPVREALAPRVGLLLRELIRREAPAGGVGGVHPGAEVRLRQRRKGQEDIGQISLGVDGQHRDAVDGRFLDEADAEAGLAAARHADADRVRDQVLRFVEDRLRHPCP